MDHLCKGCKAVGRAGGVGDNLHVLVVASLVHTHHEHGCISRGGRDDDLFCPALVMLASSPQGGEHSSRFNHVLGSSRGPVDSSRVSFSKDSNGLAVDDQFSVFSLDLP